MPTGLAMRESAGLPKDETEGRLPSPNETGALPVPAILSRVLCPVVAGVAVAVMPALAIPPVADAAAKAKPCSAAHGAGAKAARAVRICGRSARTADRQGPALRFRTPVAGGTVAGSRLTACEVLASDRRSGVRHVEFSLDGKPLGRETKAPYTCGDLSGPLAAGAHRMVARAVDTRGNATSRAVRFSVRPADGVPARPASPAAGGAAPAPAAPGSAAAPAAPRVPGVAAPAPAPRPATPAPAAPVAPVAPVGAETVFADDFEGDLSRWEQIQRAFTDRISTVDAPTGDRGRVARFEVRGTDRWNDTQRAELAWIGDKADEGETRTYSWSSFFPASYPSVDPSLYQDILQWKNDGTGTPPLQVKISGEKLSINAGPQHGYRDVWSTKLERGRWLDFSVRIRWSEDRSKGWIEASYNGQPVLARTPLQGLYPGLENYLKVGLYRHDAIQPTGVVFHDDVRVTR